MSVTAVGSQTASGRRVAHNISLDPIESEALRRMAAEEDRGILSWFIQRLIDERMCAKYGADWRQQIEAETAAAAN